MPYGGKELLPTSYVEGSKEGVHLELVPLARRLGQQRQPDDACARSLVAVATRPPRSRVGVKSEV